MIIFIFINLILFSNANGFSMNSIDSRAGDDGDVDLAIVDENETNRFRKRMLVASHLFEHLPAVCHALEHSNFTAMPEALQACLTATNFERPLQVSCASLSELRYEGDEPFATGTKKEAFFARFREREHVVVKKPRQALLHGQAASVSAVDFRNEALLMTLLQPNVYHARLLGHCAHPPFNVVERLRPWRKTVRPPTCFNFK
jgi:hypothetical protein